MTEYDPSNFSVDGIVDALNSLDKERFPDRYEILINEYKNKTGNDYHLTYQNEEIEKGTIELTDEENGEEQEENSILRFYSKFRIAGFFFIFLSLASIVPTIIIPLALARAGEFEDYKQLFSLRAMFPTLLIHGAIFVVLGDKECKRLFGSLLIPKPLLIVTTLVTAAIGIPLAFYIGNLCEKIAAAN